MYVNYSESEQGKCSAPGILKVKYDSIHSIHYLNSRKSAISLTEKMLGKHYKNLSAFILYFVILVLKLNTCYYKQSI